MYMQHKRQPRRKSRIKQNEPDIEFDNRRVIIDPAELNEELETIEQLREEASSGLTHRTSKSAGSERERLAADDIKVNVPVIDEFRTIYVYRDKPKKSDGSEKSDKEDK